MSCDGRNIERLLGRSMNPAEKAALEAHIAACPECRDEKARGERENKEFAGLLAGRRLKKDLVPEVLETVEARRKRRSVRMRLLGFVGVPAAAILVALGVSLVKEMVQPRLCLLEGIGSRGEPPAVAPSADGRAYDFVPKETYSGLPEVGSIELDANEPLRGRGTYDTIDGAGRGGGRYGGRLGGKDIENTAKSWTAESIGPSELSESQGEDTFESLSRVARNAQPPGPESIPSVGFLFRNKEVGGEAAGDPAKPQAAADRKIIRNGAISLEVESYEATYAKIGEIVAEANGFIAGTQTQRQADDKVSATVTLRVPPEAFETALAALSRLGTVRNQSISSQDVTKQYTDLQARLGAKQILEERLKKIIEQGTGSVKDLIAAEAQLGKVIEDIESLKGEIKYYDNLTGLATITLSIEEKVREQALEYVETLRSRIAVAAADPEAAFAKAQAVITEAGGQVVNSSLTRANGDEATGTILARVDAAKFEDVRKQLTALGAVQADTAENVRTSKGSAAGSATVKREQATIEITVSSPPLFSTRRTQLALEASDVEKSYQAARQAALDAGGVIANGSLTGDANGTRASLYVQVDAAKYADLMAALKAQDKVLNESVAHSLPNDLGKGQVAVIRERAEIALTFTSPPKAGNEPGFMRDVRKSFGQGFGSLGWAFRKLGVATALVAPWLAVLAVALLVWRLLRRRHVRKQTL